MTMDNTSLLSKSSYNTVTSVPHVISTAAKLRRLKIEENILLQSLHKLENDLNEALEYNIFFTETKISFNKIKNGFQDVKTSVSSQEMLKSVEIDEIRENILELENNIKSFKASLDRELLSLKSTARQLNADLCEEMVKIHKVIKPKKLKFAKYNEIVPSPVKLLMNSPFKSVEVEDYQEFMKNSLNRYGGWNEYNHNIFVNLWQKIFYPDNNSSWVEFDTFLESSSTFQAFIQELMPKLQGISIKDVISHAKWYSKYTTLKERQQKAIDKWRLNREIMKKSMVTQKVKKNVVMNIPQKYNTRKIVESNDIKIGVPIFNNNRRKCLSEESIEDKSSTKDLSNFEESPDPVEILHFLRPTKQWSNRCNNKIKEPHKYTNGLEYIKKLGTPTWRNGFRD